MNIKSYNRWSYSVDEIIEHLNEYGQRCGVRRHSHFLNLKRKEWGRDTKKSTLHVYLVGDDEVCSQDIESVLEQFGDRYGLDNQSGETIKFIQFWRDVDIKTRDSKEKSWRSQTNHFPYSNQNYNFHVSNNENLYEQIIRKGTVKNLWFQNRDVTFTLFDLNSDWYDGFYKFHNCLRTCNIGMLFIGSERIEMKGRNIDVYQKYMFDHLKELRGQS